MGSGRSGRQAGARARRRRDRGGLSRWGVARARLGVRGLLDLRLRPLRRSSAGRSSRPSSPTGLGRAPQGGLESDQRTLPRLSVSRFMSLPWRSYLGTGAAARGGAAATRRRPLAHWDEAVRSGTAASRAGVLPCRHLLARRPRALRAGVLTQAGAGPTTFRRLRRRLLVRRPALDSGAIRVFGARLDERTPISRAVAASAAVPILSSGHRSTASSTSTRRITTDGARPTRSRTGAAWCGGETRCGPSCAIRRPTPLADGGQFRSPARRLRIAIHRRLHAASRATLYTSPATDFVLLEPYERDLRLFDYPPDDVLAAPRGDSGAATGRR